MITFSLETTEGHARAGRLTTPRSVIETPVFMPVGTAATVKALSSEEVLEMGATIILGNTYHLHIRPGDDLIRELGGLHRFMNWPYSILTDSGGFQVHSLAKLKKMTEDGVSFQNHIDGATTLLTPESCIQIQQNLGADIMMCLDECLSLPAEYADVERSIALTERWAKRCKAARTADQALFGIVQGGLFMDLRQRSLDGLQSIGFDGYALGGLSVGETKEELYRMTHQTASLLPASHPRYLMGIGEPEDMLEAIEAGIDMFDCVIPTRNARNGCLFTSQGKLMIKNARYRTDPSPPDPLCSCVVCQKYSCAYLRHLYQAGEILAMRLNSYHNLHFFLTTIRQARQAIVAQRFAAFKKEFLERYQTLAKEKMSAHAEESF